MSKDSNTKYYLNGKNAKAVGIKTKKGFLVCADSISRKEITPSAEKSVAPIHQQLIAEGVLIENNGQLRFTQDYEFGSPSGSAQVLLGRKANGWIEWKTEDGKTLSEVKRVTRKEKVIIHDDLQKQIIIKKHQQLLDEGRLPTKQQLAKEYSLFRERFGPSALAEMDGEQLLTYMHDLSNRDSLVYWLEFKDDEEFNTKRFGSIAGGSSLKFRVFKRKETGNWQTGGVNANRPIDISLDDAIEIARSNRDQLVQGCELLDALPLDASDEDYAELQDQMDELVPDVSRLAWGHKYFSLLYSDRLDDFHNPRWQHYLILKMLELPPDGDGRYICAGRFVELSRELDIPIVNLDTVLNSIHGSPHLYWRVGTRSGSTNVSHWQMMQNRSCIAVGWEKVGDLSWVEGTSQSKEKLSQLLSEHHPNKPAVIGRTSAQLLSFVAKINENDVVLAADGETVLGLGRVVGGYEYHPEYDFPHQRKVEWLSIDEWKLPQPKEGLRSTLREIKRYNENLLEIECRVQSANTDDDSTKVVPPKIISSKRLSGIQGRIQSVLDRKGQVILYGPPGTGKTYWAEHTANDLAAISAFGQLYETLSDTEKNEITGNGNSSGLVRICCFHPAYGYEDFLEGYRPETIDGNISFSLRDGVFKKLCKDAEASPDKHFYLIVDEINRGDIPRIFGELLTVLEKDKRSKQIVLPVSQDVFTVPKNVFLIGTMNTADRSISLLDAALRRRFGFVEMMPDGTVLKGSSIEGIPLRAWFDALNSHIREHIGRDARNLQMGHSYLMHSGVPLKDLASLKRAIRDDIIPLLEEYCYEDYSTLAIILGEQLVDSASQRICHELFENGQEVNLVQALLAPCPEITLSSEAVSSEQSLIENEGAEEDDEEDETEEP